MVPSEIIDLHFKALEYAFPLCNAFMLLLQLYAAARVPHLRGAFLTLAFGTLLLLLPQVFQLLLTLQKEHGARWIAGDTARTLLPCVLLSTWIALPLNVFGLAWLVRKASRTNSPR
jgi:hypothetical protein